MIIEGSKPIKAVHQMTVIKKPPADVKPDETDGTSDENSHLGREPKKTGPIGRELDRTIIEPDTMLSMGRPGATDLHPGVLEGDTNASTCALRPKSRIYLAGTLR